MWIKLVDRADLNNFFHADGTSASTPVVAALLTLLNDYQLSQGRAPLGFVNPLLYSIAKTNPEAYFGTSMLVNYASNMTLTDEFYR